MQVAKAGFQENRVMASKLRDGYSMMVQGIKALSRENSRLADSALRVPFDPNSSQGSGNDGVSDLPSPLSESLPGSATTKSTPNSQKKMPARIRRNHPHGSRDSHSVLSPIDEVMEEGDVYVAEPFALAPPGLFPPADTNVSMAAEEQR